MKNKERRNIFYNGIHIELTRRCNLACAHCLRGPAQNKTMTREVIGKLIPLARQAISRAFPIVIYPLVSIQSGEFSGIVINV